MADSGYRLGKIENALLRQLWAAEGRCDGFRFALDCRWDAARVEAEMCEKEEQIASLSHPWQPLAPGAGPRVYRDAYVSALREALDIIRGLAGTPGAETEGPGWGHWPRPGGG